MNFHVRNADAVHLHASAGQTLRRAGVSFLSPLPLALVLFPSWPIAAIKQQIMIESQQAGTPSLSVARLIISVASERTTSTGGVTWFVIQSSMICNDVVWKFGSIEPNDMRTLKTITVA